MVKSFPINLSEFPPGCSKRNRFRRGPLPHGDPAFPDISPHWKQFSTRNEPSKGISVKKTMAQIRNAK